VLPLLSWKEIEVVLLDLWMPKISGEEILVKAVQDFPEIPVIIITGLNEVETAVRCMKSGAFDYMVKPVEKSRLVSGVLRAVELRELRRENTMLKQRILTGQIEHPEAFAEIITKNETMLAIFKYVEAIAKSAQPVLITGETGVGKELIARALHRLSNRKGGFVAVNAAGVDDTVFADTLFGHRKGAFTGADTLRPGMVEQAAGGTLFLDEIGELSAISQIKLLRLLQEHEYLPLGSDMPKRADARIIVATNQDIHFLRQSGKFRKDLYYRLSTYQVHVPPLRERKDDLPLLLEHFLREAARALDKKKPTVPKELMDLLNTYHFPGNVRELRSMIFDAVSHHESGILSMERFKIAIGPETAPAAGFVLAHPMEDRMSLTFTEQLPTLNQAEELLISEALKRSRGNQTVAARLLGITRQALNRRLKRKSPES
jgi:DNA-binding NtrC family response regulator